MKSGQCRRTLSLFPLRYRMDTSHPSWNEALADIINEFIEAAVHTLLHARRVYPQAIFERRRKYGVPVWMSRHPDLNDYIYQVLLRTKVFISQGIIRKVLVCFFEEGGHHHNHHVHPVEKVAFEVRMDRMDRSRAGKAATHGEANLSRERGQGDSVDQVDQTTLQLQFQEVEEIEDQFRSALLQIGKSSAHLPLRQGCTFALHVQAHEGVGAEGDEDNKDLPGSAVRSALRGGHWLLADEEERVQSDSGRRHLVPIKSVRGPGLLLDLSTELGDCPIDC
ncbi:unnamed protein product [Ascophyllum nodosum]